MTPETQTHNFITIIAELCAIAQMQEGLPAHHRKFIQRQKRMIRRYIQNKPVNPKFVPS